MPEMALSDGHRSWCSAKDVEEDIISVGVHGNPAGAGVGAEAGCCWTCG